ncbi:conserved exported hypothetical protein [Frankia canadensis]|uniref:Lipoprotein n=1 Tax=Frankia canadensis TaxID=1836972 RepID=A0A2I2KIY7_9ACTN|nr:hypothetical protein [Frankia canadensis]SNQ45632.1 conserved exported hypothetical protein [Frankia canadensis]SOU52922.1 conserved exported hypothetical protein [Frankia canadensis]
MRARPWRGARPRPLLGLGAGLLAALVALAVPACSGGGDGGGPTNGLEKLSAGEVGTRALAALRTAPGAHVAGTVADASADAPNRYDLVMSSTTTKGTIEEYGQQTQLVKIGKDTYVRRSRAYYAATGDTAASDLLADRWVRLAAADAAKYSYFTLDRYSDSLRGFTAGLTGGVRQQKVDGDRAVQASSPDGTSFLVANTGPAYPLRITVTGRSTSQLSFGDYRAPGAVTAPAGAVDLSSLG